MGNEPGRSLTYEHVKVALSPSPIGVSLAAPKTTEPVDED
jgi:hypothetical protein